METLSRAGAQSMAAAMQIIAESFLGRFDTDTDRRRMAGEITEFMEKARACDRLISDFYVDLLTQSPSAVTVRVAWSNHDGSVWTWMPVAKGEDPVHNLTQVGQWSGWFAPRKRGSTDIPRNATSPTCVVVTEVSAGCYQLDSDITEMVDWFYVVGYDAVPSAEPPPKAAPFRRFGWRSRSAKREQTIILKSRKD